MTEWLSMSRLRLLISMLVKGVRSEQYLMQMLTVVLVIFFLARYLSMYELPGNSPYPLGWWGWWDQSQYLKSAAAFSVGNLDPSQHWYPLGYPLLGAVLFKIAPTHAFFFINLASFVGFGLLLILLARQWGLSGWVGVIAILIGAVFPFVLSEQYVIPWTTTPTATLYAGFFWIYGRIIIRGISPERLTLMAILAAMVMVIRPVDILALSPAVLHTTYQAVCLYKSGEDARLLAIKSMTYGLIAGGSILGLYLILHVAIYGFHFSEYMRISSKIGFDLSIIPFRYCMIFSDPRDFFGKGTGILERYPLMNIGLFSLVYTTLFWRRFFGITTAIWVTFGLYLAYIDFLPSGIWHYKNIHYFKWIFPFLVLLSFVVLVEVIHRRQFVKLFIAALVTWPLITLHLSAEGLPALPIQTFGDRTFSLAKPDHATIAALRFNVLGDNDNATYFGHHTIEVDGKLLESVTDFRLIPNGNSVYLVFNGPRPVQSMRLTVAPGVTIDANSTAIPLRLHWSLRNPLTTSVNTGSGD